MTGRPVADVGRLRAAPAGDVVTDTDAAWDGARPANRSVRA